MFTPRLYVDIPQIQNAGKYAAIHCDSPFQASCFPTFRYARVKATIIIGHFNRFRYLLMHTSSVVFVLRAAFSSFLIGIPAQWRVARSSVGSVNNRLWTKWHIFVLV